MKWEQFLSSLLISGIQTWNVFNAALVSWSWLIHLWVWLCGVKFFVKQSSKLSNYDYTLIPGAFSSSLWELSCRLWGKLWLLSSEIDMNSFFFFICTPKRWNPIFSTQPNLLLQFDSVNGVTGHNACTIFSVILTNKDPIARACEKASNLWMCELYINEIWSSTVWTDSYTDPWRDTWLGLKYANAALYRCIQTQLLGDDISCKTLLYILKMGRYFRELSW